MKKISNKKKLIILVSLLIFFVLLYGILILVNIDSLNKYDEEILPNTYVEDFDLSSNTYKSAHDKLSYYSEYILNRKIKININSKDYDYTLRDLGVEVDVDKTIDSVKKYQKKLSYGKKLIRSNGKIKKNFAIVYKMNQDKINEALNNLKETTDYAPVDGYFDVSEGVRYVPGVDGYSLNVDSSRVELEKIISKGVNDKTKVTLLGDVLKANGNDSYKSIDTMTSAFETWFMPNTYLRNINLNTALGYINGTVVEPGEVFSYCNKAGPFNKYGYVFYYEFVGNGVCQIATTTYNAALLGGLEIVKRYPHDKKSLYVDGGLDATVASYSSGWCVDMQFKNTYEYPIYIKAYSYGGKARVEFWSNSQAKKGLEYTTSSTQIGHRGYRSFLHTWKDGQEIDVHEIETTWYIKD